ncbi:Ankyrin repeats (3 copies) [compost metagenome]
MALDHVNRLGWTALLEAIILSDGGPRHQQIVQLLVDAGADLQLADAQGVRPLQHAIARGHAETERILRAAGAR